MAITKFDSSAAFRAIIGNTTVKASKQNTDALHAEEAKKRICFCCRPSSYEKLKKIAYIRRQSVGSLIADIIDGYVAANSDKIEEYDRIYEG